MKKPKISHRLEYAAFRLIVTPLMWLPYPARVRGFGWAAQHVVGPVSGVKKRIRANLAHVFPDMPRPEGERICGKVINNAARAFIEMLAGEEFVARHRDTPIEGPGFAALQEARAQGRPAVMVSGHIGNYDVARLALRAHGFGLGGLYAPMSNPLVNPIYVAAIEAVGKPLFPRGREGLGAMLRHLRGGGMLGLVVDQRMDHGAALDFLGKPAPTALSAAEMALKYNALLIPGYAIRQPDGLTFRVHLEAPVPHGDPLAMTQALNDSLAAQVRAHMDQWFWLHRRWSGV